MAGPSWLVDSNRIATKIRSASAASDPEKVNWQSNPTKSCPNCQYIIDNSDVVHQWPGLPRGVKFDPSDQEIIWHLLAKVGVGNSKPHPFIDEFISTVNEDDGICYTHPQYLPSVKQDGSVAHFFHRAIKAYNTGTRKRRKINDVDLGDVRWHKTGRTKPVILDGVQRGCKKIMVLYVSPVRGGKAEKTNWVMHQYHLGTREDEREGEYVISKVFYQHQQVKLSEKGEELIHEGIDVMIAKVDPVTPKSVTPEPPHTERRFSNVEMEQESFVPVVQDHDLGNMEDVVELPTKQSNYQDHNMENQADKEEDKNGDEATEDNKWWENESQFQLSSQQLVEGLSLCDELLQSQSPNRDGNEDGQRLSLFFRDRVEQDHDLGNMEDEVETPTKQSNYQDHNMENKADKEEDKNGDEAAEDNKWWENESQFLLSSQQLVEGLSLCDELLQSQSPNRDGNEDGQRLNHKPLLSNYARLGPEHLKKDLEECQCLVLDSLNPANIELDTPPDFRLSQLEFESQESYIAWGGNMPGKVVD